MIDTIMAIAAAALAAAGPILLAVLAARPAIQAVRRPIGRFRF